MILDIHGKQLAGKTKGQLLNEVINPKLQDIIEKYLPASKQKQVWMYFLSPQDPQTVKAYEVIKQHLLLQDVLLLQLDAQQYGVLVQQLQIQALPALYIFSNMQPIDGFMGRIQDAELQQFLNKYPTLENDKDDFERYFQAIVASEDPTSLIETIQNLKDTDMAVALMYVIAFKLGDESSVELSFNQRKGNFVGRVEALQATYQLMQQLTPELLNQYPTLHLAFEALKQLNINTALKLLSELLFKGSELKKSVIQTLFVQTLNILPSDDATVLAYRKQLATWLY